MLFRSSQKSLESVARIYKILEETFESAKVVIAFDGGRRHRQVHHRESKNFYRKSMRIAMQDLGLKRLLVVYPGDEPYDLDTNIRVIPVQSLREELSGKRSRRS